MICSVAIVFSQRPLSLWTVIHVVQDYILVFIRMQKMHKTIREVVMIMMREVHTSVLLRGSAKKRMMIMMMTMMMMLISMMRMIMMSMRGYSRLLKIASFLWKLKTRVQPPPPIELSTPKVSTLNSFFSQIN